MFPFLAGPPLGQICASANSALTHPLGHVGGTGEDRLGTVHREGVGSGRIGVVRILWLILRGYVGRQGHTEGSREGMIACELPLLKTRLVCLRLRLCGSKQACHCRASGAIFGPMNSLWEWILRGNATKT